MRLAEVLAERQATITQKWFDAVVDTYPADTARMLKSQRDPFDNPVGSATITGLRGLFNLLCTRDVLGAKDIDEINRFLDPIIRIRAVQNFTPAKATGFVFGLKKLIRDIAADKHHFREMETLDTNIDTIGLAAFDIYMHCRETLYDIKANETRNRTYEAFQRAGLLVGEDNEIKAELPR